MGPFVSALGFHYLCRMMTVLNLAKEQENSKAQEGWRTISEQERLRIEQGVADVESGKTVPHEEMRKRYEQWL